MPGIVRTRFKREKKTKKNRVYPVYIRYLFASCKGSAIFLASIVVISLLLYKGNDFNAFIKLCIYGFCFLGAFTSGMSAYRKIRSRGFINGILGGLVYFLLCSVLIVFIMRFKFSIYILVLLPICIIAGFCGGVFGANS